MMSIITRIRDWWVTHYQSTGRIGKILFIVLPLFFTCCACTTISAMLSPSTPDPELTEVGGRLATTEIELSNAEAEEETANTTEPEATKTSVPTSLPSFEPTEPATKRPTETPERIASPRPTQSPVRAATALAATVQASQPTATRVLAPTSAPATAVPPTAIPPTTAPPTAVPPTALPPTAVPPTVAPPTAVPPTVQPEPTATLIVGTGSLVIIGVNKAEEFVDIQNIGGSEVNLSGWILRSEKGLQDCALGGVIGPSQTLRIWAMTEDAGQGGVNCGFGSNIWNNSESDPAVLIDPNGVEVSRR